MFFFKSLYPTENIHMHVAAHFIPINPFNFLSFNAGEGPPAFFNFLFNTSSSQQSQICVHSPRHTKAHTRFPSLVQTPVCSADFLQDCTLFFGGAEKWKSGHKRASVSLCLCLYALQNILQSHFAPGRKSVILLHNRPAFYLQLQRKRQNIFMTA